MPTIDRETAERIIRNDGWYDPDDKDAPDNPRAWAVIKYRNERYDRDDWSVLYGPAQYVSFIRSPAIGEFEILWPDKWRGLRRGVKL